MKTVKTQSEVKAFFQNLENQDFGYQYQICDQMIKRKIDSIINESNIHGLKLDHRGKIYKDLNLHNIDSFIEMKKVLKKYFSQFKKQDKVNECLNRVYIKDSFELWANHYDNEKEQNEFNTKFKKFISWNDAINKDHHSRFVIFDMTKKFIKISFSDHAAIEFIFNHFFNVEIDLPYNIFTKYEAGKTFYIDGLAFTFYLNGSLKLVHPKLIELKKAFQKAEKIKGNFYQF